MKAFLKRLTILTMAITTAIGASAKTDERGHTLVRLWKEYYKADRNDRPKDKIKALESIMKEAASRKLPWDHFDAGNRYLDAVRATNWSLYEEETRRIYREREELGIPIEVYVTKRFAGGWDPTAFAISSRNTLLASANSAMYGTGGLSGHHNLARIVRNDYEFVLWSIFYDTRSGKAKDMLLDHYRGAYPFVQILDFDLIPTSPESLRNERLRAFAMENQGKAAALLAEEELLVKRFNDLGNDAGAGQEAFKALADDCRAFEKKRESFKGTEGLIAQSCSRVRGLLDALEDQSLSFEIKDGVLTVVTRNVRDVRFRISRSGRTVYERTLENASGRFYVKDTLTHVLPDIEDGVYKVTCHAKGIDTEGSYRKHSLSMARRTDAGGTGVFVADARTGRPVSDYTVVLYQGGSRKARTRITGADGFAKLPEDMLENVKGRYGEYYLEAMAEDNDGKTLLSEYFYISSIAPLRTERYASGYGYTGRECIILTDRAAYIPDETVCFKAVLFGSADGSAVFDAGIGITAELSDPDGNVLESMKLKTNDMGSIAGSFKLKRSKKNGNFRISLRMGDRTLGSTSVTVDDFTPPSFTLRWDAESRKYLPGDTVNVSGSIRSFSGKNLGAAKVTYTVSDGNRRISEGDLKLDSAGKFNIAFKCWESWYDVRVKIVDTTGETQEYRHMTGVSKSLNINATLLNQDQGSASADSDDWNDTFIASQDILRVELYGSKDYESGSYLAYNDLSLGYTLRHGSDVILSASGLEQGIFEIDMSGMPSGLYTLEASGSARSEDGVSCSSRKTISIVRCKDSDESIDASLRYLFREVEVPGCIAVQTGTPAGQAWMVAELHDKDNRLLDHKMVVAKDNGKAQSLTTVAFEIKDSYPAELSMSIFFFRNGDYATYTRDITVSRKKYELPLEFTRFQELTSPGGKVTLNIRTSPDAELAATVSDISHEFIRSNEWNTYRRYTPGRSHVYYSGVCGSNNCSYLIEEEAIPFLRAEGAMTKSLAVANDSAAMEESAAADNGTGIREDFRATIAWEPFIRPDSNGNASLSFKAADKLTSYVVQLFAHDRKFNNSVLRREMLVTIPVSISMVQPSILRAGDIYTAKVSLDNCRDEDVTGTVTIQLFSGSDGRNGEPFLTRSSKVTVPAGSSHVFNTDVNVESAGTLGILASFKADRSDFGSDAVYITVPVENNTQRITESHSALLMDGADRDELIRQLRSMFINADGNKAALREISIRQMLQEAIPEKVKPANSSVLSNAEAMLACHLLGQEISQEYVDRILACRNADRGFGWFSGMSSNPLITASLLEIFAKMGGDCPGELAVFIPDAVRFLDSCFTQPHSDSALRRGYIGMEEYLYVRSLFPDVAANAGFPAEFRTAAREYLTPDGDRGLKGQIIDKARRAMTLKNLYGTSFAKLLGFSFLTSGKLTQSMNRDIDSIVQYSVEHPAGGIYFPNAVLPWRGLLESEIYAHNLLCNLLDDCGYGREADGLRLWMMIQKETQQWKDDPAYIQALATVLKGNDALLNTKVIVLTADTEIPFSQIRESGNGMRIDVSYQIDGVPVKEGQVIAAGSTVQAVYSIFSDENRSFVRIRAPRPANLIPASQLSGWDYRTRGYRSVLKGCTEFWFDSYPEKESSFTETFHVSQSGTFHAPAPEIESLYAPHYRANGSAKSMTSR